MRAAGLSVVVCIPPGWPSRGPRRRSFVTALLAGLLTVSLTYAAQAQSNTNLEPEAQRQKDESQDPGLPPAESRGPVFDELVLDGATVFSHDDVLWLLRLRPGSPLPGSPDRVAEMLQDRYKRDGYTAALVHAEFDAATRRLTLRVDEGRIDEIEFEGLPPSLLDRFRADFRVQAGHIYNRRVVREAVQALLAPAGGALVLDDRQGNRDIDLIHRAGRRVLVIPIEQKTSSFHVGVSSETREDFYSPVDGFAPAVKIDAVRFDPDQFKHTYAGGYVSYKFAREKPGYSFGIEHPILRTPRLTIGGEVHDLTASDDFWRISTTEQSLVALTFKNSFRDYYRRRGAQLFGSIRPHDDHELIAAVRWDRHESLENTADFTFFRDEHPFRQSQAIAAGKLRALVLAYTWDSRGAGDTATVPSYSRHLLDDLFRANRRQGYGARLDLTSEIAGRGLGGDYDFDRHILNARAYVPLSPRQTVAGRFILGLSGGALPIERSFALGGIGTVHGYAFKESVGEAMTLFNAEYRFDVGRPSHQEPHSGFNVFLFLDAGRVYEPFGTSRSDWLRGTGFGMQAGPFRVEFGFRLDAIPESRQILVRLSPTF